MRHMRNVATKEKDNGREWKQKNQEYLFELQKFFDVIDNIEEEEMRLDILYQMLKCDEVLTKVCEKKLNYE